MPDDIKPEFGSAIISDADLHKIFRLNKLFDMTYEPILPMRAFVKVTVVGRKC